MDPFETLEDTQEPLIEAERHPQTPEWDEQAFLTEYETWLDEVAEAGECYPEE